MSDRDCELVALVGRLETVVYFGLVRTSGWMGCRAFLEIDQIDYVAVPIRAVGVIIGFQVYSTRPLRHVGHAGSAPAPLAAAMLETQLQARGDQGHVHLSENWAAAARRGWATEKEGTGS